MNSPTTCGAVPLRNLSVSPAAFQGLPSGHSKGLGHTGRLRWSCLEARGRRWRMSAAAPAAVRISLSYRGDGLSCSLVRSSALPTPIASHHLIWHLHLSPTLLVVTGIVWYQNRSAVEPCALRASRGICGAKHDVAGLSRRDIRLNGWNPAIIETK